MSGGVATFSTHPHVAHAAGECVGTLIDGGVRRPDLMLVSVAAGFADKLGDVGALVRSLLAPSTLIGVAVEAVADGGVISADAGISMLAWSAPQGDGGSGRGPSAPVVAAVRADPDDLEALTRLSGAAAVLFADPFSVDAEALLPPLTRCAVQQLNGGFVSTARRRGGSRLLIGDRVYDDGVVGFTVSEPHAATVATSGGALVGAPVRFDGVGPVLTSIGGIPAFDAYAAMLADLGGEPDVVDAIERGLLGLAVMEGDGAARSEGTDARRGSEDPVRVPHSPPPVPRESTSSVAVVGVELVEGEPVGLRTSEPVRPGAMGHLEAFHDWAQESDLARQRASLGSWGAAVLVADPIRVTLAPMYRSGDNSELALGATVGVVCSEVFERHRGVARTSVDRLVATGIIDR